VALLIVPLLVGTAAAAPVRGASLLVRTDAGAISGGHWSSTPPQRDEQPGARAFPAVTFDVTGTLGVVYGGEGPGGAALNDTFANDGDFPGEWSGFSDHVVGTPPPLIGATIVYDRPDSVFVMFGGVFANHSASGETWELRNLTNWVEVPSSSGGPPAHAGAVLTYDAADGYVVLYDPAGNGSTWKFLGGAWSLLPTSTSPLARTGPVFAYDPAERAVLLFGGASATGPRNDSWEFAAGQWRELPGAEPTPPASAAPVGTFDPRTAGVVVYEGDAGGVTFEFAGGHWTALSAGGSGSPPARIGAGFYFDSIVDYAILFGGEAVANATVVSDVWGWNVPPPTVDPTVTPSAFPPEEVGLLAAAVAIPVVVAWWLRRRPPRKLPVSAPQSAASAAPGG